MTATKIAGLRRAAPKATPVRHVPESADEEANAQPQWAAAAQFPRLITQMLQRMLGPKGWIGLTAYLGICAYCFALAKRDAWAGILGVPANLLPLDVPEEDALPAIYAAAVAAVCLGVAMLVALVAPFLYRAASRPLRQHWPEALSRGLWQRLNERLSRHELPRQMRLTLPPLLAFGYVLVIALLGPFLALVTGWWAAGYEAGQSQHFLMMSDPKLCPAAPTSPPTTHWYCVITAESGTEIVTRWVDASGRLGDQSLTVSTPADGYAATIIRLPRVSSPAMLSPRQ